MTKIKRYYEKSNGGKIEHPDGPICFYKDVAEHLERSDNNSYSKCADDILNYVSLGNEPVKDTIETILKAHFV